MTVPRINHFVAQSHTPRNRCVRFVFGVAAASRNTRFQATRYGLYLGRGGQSYDRFQVTARLMARSISLDENPE
jgi:hypothetical protein